MKGVGGAGGVMGMKVAFGGFEGRGLVGPPRELQCLWTWQLEAPMTVDTVAY